MTLLLYGFGSGANYILLNELDIDCNVPIALDLPNIGDISSIVNVLINENKVFVLFNNSNNNSVILRWGSGNNHQSPYDILKIKHPIKSISCGWNFLLCITMNKQLYKLKNNENEFEYVAENIKLANSGWNYIIAVDNDNRLHGIGNNRYGQLSGGKSNKRFNEWSELPFNNNENKIVINYLTCGWQFSCIIDEHNNIYTTGRNKYGQLGHGDQNDRYTFEQIKDIKIKQLDCGWSHVLSIDNQDNLLSWGRNDFGQCGNKETNHILSPTVIEFKSQKHDVTNISCGSESSMISTTDGIYTWGWNEHGNLGVGDQNNRCVPTLVRNTEHQSCIGWCGAANCLYVIDSK